MRKEYNGGLTREQFLFYEMRVTAGFVTRGIDRAEILRQIREDNLFQFPTERMIASILNACLKRLDALDSPELVALLASAPVDVAKQIDMYAMMCYNRLVWDFMTGVIGEKFRTQEFTFSQKDLNLFFWGLQEQNDTVRAWSDNTVQKIKQVLKKSLIECGYLDSPRAVRLNAVAIAPELEDCIRASGDLAALPAFNCFR